MKKYIILILAIISVSCQKEFSQPKEENVNYVSITGAKNGGFWKITVDAEFPVDKTVQFSYKFDDSKGWKNIGLTQGLQDGEKTNVFFTQIPVYGEAVNFRLDSFQTKGKYTYKLR